MPGIESSLHPGCRNGN